MKEPCGTCKKKTNISDVIEETNESIGSPIRSIGNYFLKFILFLLLGSILAIIIIPLSLIVLFRVVVLSRGINLLPVVLAIGQKIFKKDEEIEEEDDELNEDDYELEDSNQIISLN